MSDDFEENTQQKNLWKGEFGNKYAQRITTLQAQNNSYKLRTGFTEEYVFSKYFDDLNRNISILEIGCNRGLKLAVLQKMGFKNISAIEINQSAYYIAKKNNPTLEIHNVSIENFNSKEKQYDLVFTATMLIHVNPSALEAVLKKILELSKTYVFGFEYYSEKLVEVPYRNQSKALWKQDFPSLYRKIDPSLKLVKREFIPYLNSDLKDVIFLLQKI